MFQGAITVSRITSTTGDGFVEITLEDSNASVNFATVQIGFAEFAQALTGRGSIKCQVRTTGLDNIGKRMEHKQIEFPLPGATWENRQDIAMKVVADNTPDGWTPDFYFRSQNSFFDRDGQTWARCTIRRWVDNETTETESENA